MAEEWRKETEIVEAPPQTPIFRLVFQVYQS